MRRILELGIRLLQLAHTFHINRFRSIHHNFGNGAILQERFDRSHTQHFIADIGYKAFPFTSGDDQRIIFQCPFHISGNNGFHFLAGKAGIQILLMLC